MPEAPAPSEVHDWSPSLGMCQAILHTLNLGHIQFSLGAEYLAHLIQNPASLNDSLVWPCQSCLRLCSGYLRGLHNPGDPDDAGWTQGAFRPRNTVSCLVIG